MEYVLDQLCEGIVTFEGGLSRAVKGAEEREKTIAFKNISLAQTYMAAIDRLGDALLLACHMLSGQPARATEMNCLLVINSTRGAECVRRNLFYMDAYNAISIIPRYNKHGIKHIPRWLVGDLAKSMVAYVALVLPVKCMMQNIFLALSPVRSASPYLWINSSCEPLTDTAIRERFTSTLYEYFGTKLLFSQWRQLASTLVGLKIGLHSPEVLRERLHKLVAIPLLQAGHSVETALAWYDISDLNFRSMDPLLLAATFNFSCDWIEFMSRGIVSSDHRRGMLNTSKISGYNEPGISSGRSKEGGTTNAMASCKQHHDSSGMRVEGACGDDSKSLSSRTEINNDNVYHHVANDILLSIFPNEYPRWRNTFQLKSAVASLKALDIVSDHLFIGPTASGKTLVALTPILAEQRRVKRPREKPRTTIILCPLVALVHDLHRRVSELIARAGVPLETLSLAGTGASNGDHPIDMVKQISVDGGQVIIATIEAFNTARIKLVLDNLSHVGKLGSFIIDEIQTVLLHSTFRPALREVMLYIRKFEASPIFMLSGTFPPPLIPVLHAEYGMQHVLVERAVCSRPNLYFLRSRVLAGT
jgi:hypothetical protein